MEDGGGSRSLRVCGVVVFKGSILCQPFGLYKVNGSIQPWTCSVGLCLTTGLDIKSTGHGTELLKTMVKTALPLGGVFHKKDCLFLVNIGVDFIVIWTTCLFGGGR